MSLLPYVDSIFPDHFSSLDRAVGSVYVCVWQDNFELMTFDLDIRRAHWFILNLSRSPSKVKIIYVKVHSCRMKSCLSSSLHWSSGATFSEAFLVWLFLENVTFTARRTCDTCIAWCMRWPGDCSSFTSGCFIETAEVLALGWLRGSVVERRSLAGVLSLSCARPVADGWPLMSVNRPLWVNQPGQLSLSSLRGR